MENTGEGGSHQHEVEIPSHEHNLEFGIYEDTRPANVDLLIDNGDGFTTPTTKYYLGIDGVSYKVEYDNTISLGNPDSDNVLCEEKSLVDYFYGTGWKRIKFTSSQLGRINAQLIIKVDLTA